MSITAICSGESPESPPRFEHVASVRVNLGQWFSGNLSLLKQRFSSEAQTQVSNVEIWFSEAIASRGILRESIIAGSRFRSRSFAHGRHDRRMSVSSLCSLWFLPRPRQHVIGTNLVSHSNFVRLLVRVLVLVDVRSEERRVGKEGRCRWSV